MANVYSVAFTVLGVIVMHACLLVWSALLLPRPVERARKRIENRPLSSLLIGLVASLLTLAVACGFFLVRAQNVRLVTESLDYLSETFNITRFYNDAWIVTNGVAWLLATPVMAGFVIGGAAFAELFALRARTLLREDRPLVGLAVGALCTSSSYFLPFVGWFVFLPLVGLMSIGAGLCGLFETRGARAENTRSSVGPREPHVLSNR